MIQNVFCHSLLLASNFSSLHSSACDLQRNTMPVTSLSFPSYAALMESSNRPCDIILVIIHARVMLAVPLTLLESNEERKPGGRLGFTRRLYKFYWVSQCLHFQHPIYMYIRKVKTKETLIRTITFVSWS